MAIVHATKYFLKAFTEKKKSEILSEILSEEQDVHWQIVKWEFKRAAVHTKWADAWKY